MKIFLSAVEGSCYDEKYGRTVNLARILTDAGIKMKYNLVSYYYLRKDFDTAVFIRDNSEEVLVDSGGHTLKHGVKVNYKEFTEEYAKFIKEFDRPNVIGYFEMDVDNIIGYQEVLKLRKILESVSDKIIPVWHPNRGIEEYKKMCQQYSGKIVAITGFKDIEIKKDQYIVFLKYARKYNCKLHCLGMTRKAILDKVPFDYVDSSSWVQSSIYGRAVGIKNKKASTENYSKKGRKQILIHNYSIYQKMQEDYYKKWRKECKD